MDEIQALLNAILENQQVTNAKLEALTMDVHQLTGRVERLEEKVDRLEVRVVQLESTVTELKSDFLVFRRETRSSFRQLEGYIKKMDLDLEETIERVDQLEQSNKA